MKPADLSGFVQKDGGDLGRTDQVVKVAGGGVEFEDLLLVFRVDAIEFFIDRVQFFVGALQLLVGGQQLLVGALQFLIAGFQLLNRALQ